MLIREFRPGNEEFEQVIECCRRGFSPGHNRYTLARLARIQRETMLVAEDLGRVVGVVVGICSPREAWMTSLSVLPDERFKFSRISPQLLIELGNRFVALGFKEAFATTGRQSVVRLATSVGATLVGDEKDFYFDGKRRYLFKANPRSLALLSKLC